MTSNSQLLTDSSEDDVFKCATCTSTLHDPVLLRCLHSVCRSCTSGATANVTCTVCQVTTDTSTGKTNTLVASLKHRSQVLKNVFSCRHCVEEANEEARAVVWCYVCQQSFCPDLQKYHSIMHPAHQVMHLNEGTLLSELYRVPSQYCVKHGEELKLACFTCQDCRCFKCVHELCYSSSHKIQPLDGTDAFKHINDRIADLKRVISDVNLKNATLQSFIDIPEAVDGARQESLRVLQAAKEMVIDSVNKAYKQAESSLLTCWDTLKSQSLCLRETVERLQARLAWANKYCQLALSSNDMSGLFSQLEAIFSSLSSLLVEAGHFKQPTDPLKMVSLNVYLPCDLDLITSDWFGQSKVLSEDFNSSVTDVPAGGNSDYYTRKVSTLMELEQHLQKLKDEQKRHECAQQSLEQLQSEMKSKDQQLIALQNEVKKLLDAAKEQREPELRTVAQLQLELKSKTQQLDLRPERHGEKFDGRHLKDGKMQIFVRKTTGGAFIFQVEPRDTIWNLKKKIQEKTDIPLSHQLLKFAFLGKDLQDDMILTDLGIHNGSTLELHPRAPR